MNYRHPLRDLEGCPFVAIASPTVLFATPLVAPGGTVSTTLAGL